MEQPDQPRRARSRNSKPWSKYRCAGSGWTEFDQLWHTTHVIDAFRNIDAGRLKRTNAVFGTGSGQYKLRGTWTSPIRYPYQSHYGTVQLAFDWKRIIRKYPYIYWAGAELHERMHLKFVLSDDPLLQQKSGGNLRPYPVKSSEGPLRRRKGKWRYAGGYDFEFFIVKTFKIARATRICFTQHSDYCHREGVEFRNCPERGLQSNEWIAGARVVAYVLGHKIHTLDHVLRARSDRDWPIADDIRHGLIWLLDQMKEATELNISRGNSRELLTAMRRYARDGEIESAAGNVSGYVSSASLEKDFDRVIKAHLSLPRGWNVRK